MAITVGALAGATLAVAHNREHLYESAISLLDKGSNYFKQKLEMHKVQQMAVVEDDLYGDYDDDDSATTPDQSEWEDELEADALD